MTFGNSLEFASHEMISKELDTKIYFANPYASCKRGINENINGLIRKYFSEGTNFNKVTNREINFVVNCKLSK